MPYRCFACDKLLRTSYDPACNKECDISYVDVIHFAHPTGVGKVVGSGVRLATNETDRETLDAPMRLCCYSDVEFPKHTAILSAVTCLNCLDNINKKD